MADNDTGSNESGELSVASAMDALATAREKQGATSEPVVVERTVETKIEPDPAEPETQEPEADAKPETEAAQAPDDWTDEDKEWFSTLTPERQSKFVERAKAAEQPQAQPDDAQRQALDVQINQFRERNNKLGDIVDAGAKAFQERWGKFTPADWQKLADTDQDQWVKARAMYEAEADTLRNADAALKEAREASQKEESRLHMEALARDLPTIAPDLADIKTGKLAKTVEFLKRTGVPAENIPRATALELALAHDAMLYREGRKVLADKPKPAPPVARPTAKPSAAPQGSSQARNAAALAGQLKRSGSVNDAVALLQARRAVQ